MIMDNKNNLVFITKFFNSFLIGPYQLPNMGIDYFSIDSKYVRNVNRVDGS